MDRHSSKKSNHALITVVGSHAGESLSAIILRKQKEVQQRAIAYWLFKSFKARTLQVQGLCKEARLQGEVVDCYFIEASQKNGARPTNYDDSVKFISEDAAVWKPLTKECKITGKIDKQSTALVLSDIRLAEDSTTVDLWDYSEFQTGLPVKLQLGASTVCCYKTPSIGMQSRLRRVIATGKLCPPYAVWVKSH